MKKAVSLIIIALAFVCFAVSSIADNVISKSQVLADMKRAADWQLKQMGNDSPIDWRYGALYTGIMSLARTAQEPEYSDAMLKIAEKNSWKPGPRPFHADDHCVGQMYLELYASTKDAETIEPLRQTMDGLVAHINVEDKLTWDWCDALFMAPATLAELSEATGNRTYLDAMDKEWWRTTDALYDKNEHLYFRDARFLKQKTPNGKPIFWARGNGWVIAGIARVLSHMPADYPSRSRYIGLFKDMSAAIAALQGADGLWRPSLLDANHISKPETSSSGFFCYALAWGINEGILDGKVYRPVVEKAWNSLTGALSPDGKLGFVQPVGDSPAAFDSTSSQPYGVGAFLLAGSEVYRMLSTDMIAPAQTTDQISKVVSQYHDYILSRSSVSVKQAFDIANRLDPGGSWPDIDYKSKQRAAWPSAGHAGRILSMAIALHSKDISPVDQSALLNAIHSSLGNWIKNDPQCPNWWYNQIGVPQSLGSAAVLLGDKLNGNELDYITKVLLPRSKIGMTGQNKVWLAGNTLFNGVLLQDQSIISRAANTINSEIRITTSEGIQPDFSFHQHGPQLQFGNYGLAFADEQLKWAIVLKDTKWALPSQKLDVLSKYILDGLTWVVWQGAMDISCCGRQLSPDSPAGKGSSVLRLLHELSVLDKKNVDKIADKWDSIGASAKNSFTGCSYFWRSDYGVYRTKDTMFTLKMCSTRTIGSESLNDENLSGYYLADGAMYIYRNGDEYRNIFPVWDWRKLPGVTCAKGTGSLPSFRSYSLSKDFVGGVSDGVSMCAAINYSRDGVSAKKFWMFAGGIAVCLGAGISSANNNESDIATTLNQCLLKGDVFVAEGDTGNKMTDSSRVSETVNYVEHNGLRYTFLQPEKVVISHGKQTGTWSKVRKVSPTPTADESMDVFCLEIDHGIQPKEQSYAYSVTPINAKSAKPEILTNTEQVQAVCVGNVTGAAFYSPGRIDNGKNQTLEVYSPCIVMIAGKRVFVCDPTQKLTNIKLCINKKSFAVVLPTGQYAGSSVEIK